MRLQSKKTKIANIQTRFLARPYIYIILILFFNISLNLSLFGADIQGLTVSPSTAGPGDAITINFGISGSSSDSLRFAVGLSRDNTVERCEEDWIADETGVFGATEWYYGTISTTTVTVTEHTVTDTLGPDTGLYEWDGTGIANYESVTIVSKIPLDLDYDPYVIVVAADGQSDTKTLCDDNNETYETSAATSSAITISGTPEEKKLDLVICNSSSTTDSIRLEYSIFNRGYSGVRINDLKFRWYINFSGTMVASARAEEVYYPDNTKAHNNNWIPTSTVTAMSLTQCAGSRNANQYFERATTNGIDGFTDGMVPPAGGYLTNSTVEKLYLNANSFDVTDDYSRHTDLGSCGSPSTDTKYATLYYEDSLVCEWDDSVAQGGSDTLDADTGEEPCEIGCQSVDIEKSASTYIATIGDTITFCITYTNNMGTTQTFNIWDTVPATTTYIGCDSCSRQFYGDTTVVWWLLNNIADGASGTVCFWVRINGYPYYDFEKEYFSYWYKWNSKAHKVIGSEILYKILSKEKGV